MKVVGEVVDMEVVVMEEEVVVATAMGMAAVGTAVVVEDEDTDPARVLA